jgi:hypothetical protein
MGVMAIAGLTFAWRTVDWRRGNDPRPFRGTGPQVAPPVTPSELAALAWLPPEIAVILAVHVADVQRTQEGKDVLRRWAGGGLGDLENWTGLQLDEIDHAVLGLKLDQRILPPLLLVVQTRQPLDLPRIRAALKAGRSSELGKKTVYHFTPKSAGKVSLDVLLWRAAPTTLVLSLTRGDLETLPDRPPPAGNPFPGELQLLIQQRIDPASQVWLAGHVEKWDALLPLLSVFLAKEDFEPLTRLRSFAFGLQVEQGLKLAGAVRCPDQAVTRELEDQWARWNLPEGTWLRKGWEPVFREMGQTYRARVKDGWLTINAEAGEAIVRQAIGP